MKNPQEIKSIILAAFAAAGILTDDRITGTSYDDAENRRIFIALFMSQLPKHTAMRTASRLIPELIAATRYNVYYCARKHADEVRFCDSYRKKYWEIETQFLKLI